MRELQLFLVRLKLRYELNLPIFSPRNTYMIALINSFLFLFFELFYYHYSDQISSRCNLVSDGFRETEERICPSSDF